MNNSINLPDDVVHLIRRAKKELRGEFVAYPLDSGLTIEEFRKDLTERLNQKKVDREITMQSGRNL